MIGQIGRVVEDRCRLHLWGFHFVGRTEIQVGEYRNGATTAYCPICKSNHIDNPVRGLVGLNLFPEKLTSESQRV